MVTWHTLPFPGRTRYGVQYNHKMHILNGINGVLAIQNSAGVIWCLKYDNRYAHKPLLPCFVDPFMTFVDGERLHSHFGWLSENHDDMPFGYRAWFDCFDGDVNRYLDRWFSVIMQVYQGNYEVH
jgi:hypothetical protein